MASVIESRAWTLAFDGQPPGPNDRLHWATKARLTKAWRAEAALMAKQRQIPRLERARLTLTIVRPRLGVADPDNDASRAKAIVDGLRDAQVLAGDTYHCVEFGQVREERGEPGCRLLIEEVLK